MAELAWEWDKQSSTYGNYGNANQWTVNAGLASLARESTQNTNDARSEENPSLVYTFIRLSGEARSDFLRTLNWSDELEPHLRAMSSESAGAVTAGHIKTGLEAMAQPDPLVLLKVSDYGCRGLTGPEFSDIDSERFGNFIKLCRLDLFSGKNETSGGSFGLGKAVYWRFSRIQTVLFNSMVADSDAVDGNTRNRLFGVNQGVVHRVGTKSFQGRGYFGVPRKKGSVTSTWASESVVESLHLQRAGNRPGTSAMIVGFYDPDEPDRGDTVDGLIKMAEELRSGIEESFWPLLARRRLQVRIEVVNDCARELDTVVDPEDTYTELVRALRRFDSGDLDETLDETYSVVARDIPISISKRKSGAGHAKFVHNAKLVVTKSDKQKDPLENKVCLLRQPEMVVQTLDRTFENHTYHAFLLAGGAVNPDSSSAEDRWADDFLRFAEPPAHDQWIPRGGRNKSSQSSLSAHYVAPWVPNLQAIEKSVAEQLLDLFGAPPPTGSKPPTAVFKHLSFLRGEAGEGGATGTTSRKPTIDITEWKVVDGHWHLTFRVKARNEPGGWALSPALYFIGLDGGGQEVAWDSLRSDDARIEDGAVLLEAKEKGRFVQATVTGVSVADLPIPAEDSAVDVQLRNVTNTRRKGATA
ncbi:hypothetical protein [Rhodococcus wratislaviensis]|uniref:hypothetical protein n=1 Tax=Rhodococcus wratislaviensis TaxID=44752 RepID=UPI003517AA20